MSDVQVDARVRPLTPGKPHRSSPFTRSSTKRPNASSIGDTALGCRRQVAVRHQRKNADVNSADSGEQRGPDPSGQLLSGCHTDGHGEPVKHDHNAYDGAQQTKQRTESRQQGQAQPPPPRPYSTSAAS
jgi:hypothetical protein